MEIIIVWKRNDDIILNRLVIIFLAMDKYIYYFHCTKSS